MKICTAPDCEKVVYARGLCSTHINRFYKYGTYDLPERGPKPTPVRMTVAGCWLYRRKLTRQGYGRTTRNGRQVLVHRYVWEQFKGAIPDGMHLHHTCRNRACCNPDHLTLLAPVEHFDQHWATAS